MEKLITKPAILSNLRSWNDVDERIQNSAWWEFDPFEHYEDLAGPHVDMLLTFILGELW